MTDRELMQQALKALEWNLPVIEDYGDHEQLNRQHQAITALRERLAQPEQEPIGWTSRDYVTGDVKVLWGRQPPLGPLYTTPPHRKPLTDEQIKVIWRDIDGSEGMLMRFARAIEAAHGIKGEA